MEKWEYAAGYRTSSGQWRVFDIPGTYEHARTMTTRLELQTSNEGTVSDSCVVRRSPRHPAWQPVRDHAAELLAEVLADAANAFRREGRGVMQGYEVDAVLTTLVRQLDPSRQQSNQEFD